MEVLRRLSSRRKKPDGSSSHASQEASSSNELSDSGNLSSPTSRRESYHAGVTPGEGLSPQGEELQSQLSLTGADEVRDTVPDSLIVQHSQGSVDSDGFARPRRNSADKKSVSNLRRGSSDQALERQSHLRNLQAYGLDSFVQLPPSVAAGQRSHTDNGPASPRNDISVSDDGQPAQRLNYHQILAPALGHNYSHSYPARQSFPVPQQQSHRLGQKGGSESASHSPQSTSGSSSPTFNGGSNSPPPLSSCLTVPAEKPPKSKRFSSGREKKLGGVSPLSLPGSNTPQGENLKSPLSPRSPRTTFATWTKNAFSPRRKSQQYEGVDITAAIVVPVSSGSGSSLLSQPEEDKERVSSPRRLSLKGFPGFRRNSRQEQSVPTSPGTEDPAQAQGTDSTTHHSPPSERKDISGGLFRGHGGHLKSKSLKVQPHQSQRGDGEPGVDKAFGIYNSVLKTQKNNTQVADDPASVSSQYPLEQRTRSRSGDHTYGKEKSQPEFLVRRPTGKLRQTLMKPFTALGSTRFSSSKREQARQKQGVPRESSPPPNLPSPAKQVAAASSSRSYPTAPSPAAQGGHHKTKSQPLNSLRGGPPPSIGAGAVIGLSPTSPRSEPRPVSMAPSTVSSVGDMSMVEHKPLTGSNERLPAPQFELHSLRLSSDRSRSSSQKTQRTQTSDERSSLSTGSPDATYETLADGGGSAPSSRSSKEHVGPKPRQYHPQFTSNESQLYDLKKVLNFVEPGELLNLTQTTEQPLSQGGSQTLGSQEGSLEEQELTSGKDRREGSNRSAKGKSKRPHRSAPEIKTYFDCIRNGQLFMLLPAVSEHWNLFFSKLSMLRFNCYETEESQEPIFSLLLTEINEIQKEQRKDSQECVITIFSHSVPVVKFMASAQQAKEWMGDIDAARVESLRNLCSTAVGRVGHARQTSFDQNYNLSGDKGIGGYSFVKEAIEKTSGRNVIVKFLNKAMVKLGADGLPDEIDILLKVKHANIVEIKEVFESDDYFIFIMDKFGKGMDLFDFLQDHEKLSEPEARCIFRQVLSAVEHLASQNLVHGDIKDENIIIDQETQQIKLIDFGSNKRFTPTEEFMDYHGTKHMACPEVVDHLPFKPLRQEIWSLGVLLYILLTGEVPFETEEEIRNGALPEELRFQLSDECRDLLCMMLETNPRYQASLSDIVNHDWLKHQDVSPFHNRRLSSVAEVAAVPDDSLVAVTHPPSTGTAAAAAAAAAAAVEPLPEAGSS